MSRKLEGWLFSESGCHTVAASILGGWPHCYSSRFQLHKQEPVMIITILLHLQNSCQESFKNQNRPNFQFLGSLTADKMRL